MPATTPAPPDDSDVLLTREQTAALLNVSGRTVQNWTTRGLLHQVPMGPRWVRYRKSEVDALLNGDGMLQPNGADQA